MYINTFRWKMLNDILFTILLHADIVTIINYNMTSKKSVCNDYFWITKSKKDELPMIPISMKEHYKMDKIKKQVQKLLDIGFDMNIMIEPHFILDLVFNDIVIANGIQLYQRLIFRVNGLITYKRLYFNPIDNFISEKSVSQKELLDILIKIIYYYPNIIIEDCLGDSLYKNGCIINH